MRKRILRRIFNTTITVFIILVAFTLTKTNYSNTLRAGIEIDKKISYTNKVYLLNKDDLFVEVGINSDKNNLINNIIKYLYVSNDKTPNGLRGYIPSNIKLLDYSNDKGILTINFNDSFYKSNNIDLMVKGIVYSLINVDGIEGIRIKVNGKQLKGYDSILDKRIGINNEFLFSTRYDINEVVVYYIDKIDGKDYYVPVTKYLNDSRKKIEIIVDELKTSNNLISYLNDNTKLIDYREENNVLFLNFNKYLIDNNKSIKKEILNSIAYSVFDSYDVNMVCFEVDSKRVDYIVKE